MSVGLRLMAAKKVCAFDILETTRYEGHQRVGDDDDYQTDDRLAQNGFGSRHPFGITGGGHVHNTGDDDTDYRQAAGQGLEYADDVGDDNYHVTEARYLHVAALAKTVVNPRKKPVISAATVAPGSQ